MKSAKTLLVIILIIIVAFLFYRNKNSSQNPDTHLDQGSIVGCYKAIIAKDVYTLSITDEINSLVNGTLTYNNFEKDSSSGTFIGTYKDGILMGDYSFDSEGMHSVRQVIFKKDGDNFVQGFGSAKMVNDKEVFTDLSTISYDSKNIFIKSESCSNSNANLKNYREAGGIVTFDYPAEFSVVEGSKDKLVKDWRLNSNSNGNLLATLTVPKDLQPNTNFSSAKLTVGKSSDTTAVKNCKVVESFAKDEDSVSLGHEDFDKVTFSEGAAGNFYDSTSYRSVFDGECYVVEYTIHSTNIGNYSPEQNIKEFDKAKIVADLEEIVMSMKFELGGL